MDLDLTDVDGISEATAKELRDAGFESVEGIATAGDDLEDVKGFGPARADEIGSNAQALLEEHAEATTAEENLDTVSVSYEIDAKAAIFVIKGLVDETVRLHARREMANRNRANKLLRLYLEQYLEAGEENFEYTLEATMDDLNIFTRSLSNAITDLRSQNGIKSKHSTLQVLREEVDADRDEHWGM